MNGCIALVATEQRSIRIINNSCLNTSLKKFCVIMKIEGSANFIFCDKLFQSKGDLTCLHDKNSEGNNSISCPGYSEVIHSALLRYVF